MKWQAKLGDPSLKIQNFIDVKLNLLCCRYWYLDQWDCHEMAFPFWRIYWNKNTGGELQFKDEIYEMTPDYIYIIPPYTPFNSKFKNNHKYKSGIHVEGKNMTVKLNESYYESKSLIHFFTHFRLGIPFDNVYPGIYQIEATNHRKESLDYITNRLKIENYDFKITFNLKLQSFVLEILSNIGPELWKTIKIDDRVLSVIRHIENNIEKRLSNVELSSLANMAPNSFARLFKQETHMTLKNFVQSRKIARACELFTHSNKNVESVAFELGFSDRFHFSRIFKSVTGLTPAKYRSDTNYV